MRALLLAILSLARLASGADAPDTSKTILLGQSAAFAESTRDAESWLGEMACFDQVNAAGGVQGRKIALLAVDDGGDPEEVLADTVRLVDMDGVFELFGYGHTSALNAAMPMLHKYSRDHVVLFSNYSGAEYQRQPGALECVFNVRASYRREAESLVHLLSEPMGLRKVGLLVQKDPQSQAVAGLIRQELSAHGLSPVAESEIKVATPEAGAKGEGSGMGEQVGEQKDAGAQVVIALADAPACSSFVRTARQAGFMAPVAVLSLTDTDLLLDSLDQKVQGQDLSLTARLLSTQVVPSWSDLNVPLVKEYRAAMDKATTRLPEDLKAKTRKGAKYAFASLEGYLNAKLVTEVLAKTPKTMLRKDFQLMVETGMPWDCGLGSRADFRDKRPQGLTAVYTLVVKDHAWVPLADPDSLK